MQPPSSVRQQSTEESSGVLIVVTPQCRYRWIKNLPGAPEYTGKFTTAADQDVQQVLTTILTYKLYQAPDYKQLQPQEQISSDLYKAFVRAEFERDQRLRSPGRARKRTAKISPVIAGKMLEILKKVVTGGESLWPGRQNRLKFFQDLAMKISDDVIWHDRDAYLPIWPEVMAELYEELEASNVVWIGMYIALVNELLLSQPQLLQLMERYRHVLVDEVQDNDRSQYDFVSTICKRHQNVFFVGDLEQAIYQFRGADAELFGTEVTRTFPAIKDYGMYENYRSLNSIVRVAETVARALESSGGHLRKSSTVMRPGDLPVVFTAAQNEQEEAERIVESVQHFLQSGVPGSEIAVIYPKHVYGDGVEARLLRQRIPYRRYGNTEILNSAVGRDLLAYLAMVANPLHRPALNRIYNKPARGIAEAGWQKLHNQLDADPRGPSLPAFLFGGLDDVWVAPEVVQALLDECFKEEEPEKLMVRLKQLMQEETQAGRLAPELDFTSVNLPKKPTVNQRQALQALRNLLVCVWSEAARHGPERAMAVLQILSGYRDQLMASDDDGLDIADFFVVMMRDSVTDPAGGALGVHMEGAWDGAAGLESMAPPATDDDVLPDALPDTPPGYSAGENEDYFQSLLRPNQPLMHVRSLCPLVTRQRGVHTLLCRLYTTAMRLRTMHDQRRPMQHGGGLVTIAGQCTRAAKCSRCGAHCLEIRYRGVLHKVVEHTGKIHGSAANTFTMAECRTQTETKQLQYYATGSSKRSLCLCTCAAHSAAHYTLRTAPLARPGPA
eukprot:jgi/Ulvmu1/6973/UM033_0031.1